MEVEGAQPETYDVIAFGPAGETRYARYKGADPCSHDGVHVRRRRCHVLGHGRRRCSWGRCPCARRRCARANTSSPAEEPTTQGGAWGDCDGREPPLASGPCACFAPWLIWFLRSHSIGVAVAPARAVVLGTPAAPRRRTAARTTTTPRSLPSPSTPATIMPRPGGERGAQQAGCLPNRVLLRAVPNAAPRSLRGLRSSSSRRPLHGRPAARLRPEGRPRPWNTEAHGLTQTSSPLRQFLGGSHASQANSHAHASRLVRDGARRRASLPPRSARLRLSTAGTTGATKDTGPRSRRRKPRLRSAAPGTSTAPPDLPPRPLPSIRPLTRA